MNWIIFLAGALNLFLGFLVWSRDNYKKLNYLFGLFSLITGLLCFFDFIFRYVPDVSVVRWSFAIAALLPGAAYLWVHELFEKKLSLVKTMLFLLPGIIFFYFSITGDLIVQKINFLTFLGYQGEVGILFPYYSFYIFLFSLYIIIRIYQEQKLAISLKRSQLRFTLFGLISYSFLASFFSLLLPTFFGIYDLTLLDAPSSLFFVGFSSYAILRYRLMDIRVVIRQGIVVFTALSLLISLSVPMVILVAHIVDYEINYFVFWIAVAIFTGCVLLFIPLKNLLERFFNKYFFASLYNEEQILKNLIREIPKTLNLDELTNLVINTTRKALQIEKISLWSIDVQDKDYIPLKKIGFKAGAKKDIVKNRIIAKYFLRYHEPIIYQEIDKLIDDPELITPERIFEKLKKSMETQEVDIIVPLVLKKELVGMMFLGPKIDRASYSDQDIDVLKIIADQSAVALENANLYRETQRFADKMKKEVKRATAKLRKINKQLTKLDKAKSEFISIASHQLRTPITAIKGYTSMVLEGDYGKVNKTLIPAIKRIFISSERMNALVENLLNISRIESGKVTYDFKEINFSEMVENITKEFGSIVKRKGLELTCSCPKKMPMVSADEVKIREVVSNLIDNAIKYTDKGKIRVQLRVVDEYKSNFLLFSVKDTGMGIADEDLPNVFQKFRRGKKVALVHTEGLGLGMYFSQKVVEAHKGKIWVESLGVGKGSTFYVRLPV
jgi:signal transduction histidine kinase